MKRVLIKLVINMKYHIRPYPRLEHSIKKVVNHFPALKAKLKQVGNQKTFYASFVSTRKNRELLIDVTNVYADDLKTGIQRVVRSIVNELKNIDSLENIDIQPVFLTDRSGYWCYRYVNEPAEMVVPKAKDIFLGLDFNVTVTEASYAGLFTDWKSRGVQICFVVYDILPILHPHWWYDGVSQAHEEWLKTVISYSDKVFCISQTVSNDVKKYITLHPSSIQNKPSIDWFHLGADVDNSVPSKGIPENAEAVLNQFGSKPSFLMVATVEPRKGHEKTLIAFEKLWADQVDVNLVIVGKAGWLVNDLVQKIRRHIELNKRLFWLEAISDEYLEKVYAASTCLIAASEGEGFGLPLIEAAQHKLPIIARDITVFREVAGEHAYYFPNDSSPEVLTDVVKEWLELNKGNLNPKSDNMPWLTWAQSAQKITELMMLNNSKI